MNRARFLTAIALLRWNLQIFKKSIGSTIIDSCIQTFTQFLVIGKLFPLMGMNKDLIPPLFLGGATILPLISLGYYKTMNLTQKIAYDRMGDLSFHMVMPLSIWWVMATYVCTFVIEACVITTPLLIGGTFLLHDTVLPALSNNPHWPLFLLIHLLGITAIGLFFFSCAFVYDSHWFKNNIWTRRVHFIVFMSANLYTWHDVASYSPTFGYILLLNPTTYFCEGLRASILSSSNYIAAPICLLALLATCFFFAWQLRRGIIKRIDPVWR